MTPDPPLSDGPPVAGGRPAADGYDTVFLPVPDLVAAELRRDPVALRATPAELRALSDFAWSKGERVARELGRRTGWQDPGDVARGMGLRIETTPRGGALYSEYTSRTRLIELHRGAIRRFARAATGLVDDDPDRLAELFVAHELFHALECTDPAVGLTFRQRRIATLRCGPWQLRAGLRSLSEVAAHAFTRTYVPRTSAGAVLSARTRADWEGTGEAHALADGEPRS